AGPAERRHERLVVARGLVEERRGGHEPPGLRGRHRIRAAQLGEQVVGELVVGGERIEPRHRLTVGAARRARHVARPRRRTPVANSFRTGPGARGGGWPSCWWVPCCATSPTRRRRCSWRRT